MELTLHPHSKYMVRCCFVLQCWYWLYLTDSLLYTYDTYMMDVPLFHSIVSRATENHQSAPIITMTSWCVRWRLKSPASRLFSQPIIQTQIKENIKAPRRWPLCGEFTGDRPVTRKMFPFDDVIMVKDMTLWGYWVLGNAHLKTNCQNPPSK